MNYPTSILRQAGFFGQESKIALQYALTYDCDIQTVVIADVKEQARPLIEEGALPIGSVEFVREVMAAMRIQHPENISYPEGLQPLLKRRVERKRIAEACYGAFIKPVQTKLFTGFVLKSDLDEHDNEQLLAASRLPADTEIWESDAVSWLAEYRYYVLDGEILGYGRYDPNESDVCPDEDFVQQALQMSMTASLPRAFSMDIGVLESGESALVEFNDAWALGYYKGTLSREDYLRLIFARWQEIRSNFELAPKQSQNKNLNQRNMK